MQLTIISSGKYIPDRNIIGKAIALPMADAASTSFMKPDSVMPVPENTAEHQHAFISDVRTNNNKTRTALTKAQDHG